MSDVNKQLLDVASELVKFQAIYEKNTREIGRMPGNDLYGPMLMRIVDCAKEAIAAAELAQQADIGKAISQQAEPVAWHTNDPCVSGEHIEAIAKVCKIIPSYTTVEYVDRIIGFGHVLLADKSVQEAFVRANSHLLRADPARPPVVPDGCALVQIEPTEEMLAAMRERHWVIRGCQLCEEDYRDIFSSMLAATAKP